MSVIITAERPDSPDAVLLIAELDAMLEPLYPRESRHGLSVDRLLAEGVDFYLLRADGIAAGCGGIKLYGPEVHARGERLAAAALYCSRVAAWSVWRNVPPVKP